MQQRGWNLEPVNVLTARSNAKWKRRDRSILITSLHQWISPSLADGNRWLNRVEFLSIQVQRVGWDVVCADGCIGISASRSHYRHQLSIPNHAQCIVFLSFFWSFLILILLRLISLVSERSAPLKYLAKWLLNGLKSPTPTGRSAHNNLRKWHCDVCQLSLI